MNPRVGSLNQCKWMAATPSEQGDWLPMLSAFLSSIFGCSHSRTTFPLTPFRRSQLTPAGARKGTYVVCLDCGKEFDYDWQAMRVGELVGPNLPVPAHAAHSEQTLAH